MDSLSLLKTGIMSTVTLYREYSAKYNIKYAATTLPTDWLKGKLKRHEVISLTFRLVPLTL